MGLLRRRDGLEPREAAELVDRGEAILLDVREHAEWRAGHAPGATHIPLGELGQRFGQLPRDRTIVGVCRSGNRSALAADTLRRAGLDAANLEGGMKAWRRAGLPLEPNDGHVV